MRIPIKFKTELMEKEETGILLNVLYCGPLLTAVFIDKKDNIRELPTDNIKIKYSECNKNGTY